MLTDARLLDHQGNLVGTLSGLHFDSPGPHYATSATFDGEVPPCLLCEQREPLSLEVSGLILSNVWLRGIDSATPATRVRLAIEPARAD